jgi:hypothetical protein
MMKIGMLWYDNDVKSDLAVKIERAMSYYREKYGDTPNLCFVHPSMLAEKDLNGTAIEVRTTRSVLPNHFWLGIRTNLASAD